MISRTSGPWRLTSNPPTIAVPLDGGKRVTSIFTVVDFPAPFGPEEPVDLALLDVEIDAVDGTWPLGVLPY